MTPEEIHELYQERVAIMQEGNSRDLDWFDTDEINKRLTRAAYFDTKKKIGGAKMPSELNPDKPAAIQPVTAMRKKAEHIDFGFLLGAIRSNPKAIPSNIDAVMERGGRFLFIEFKRPGESFGLGQEIMLRRLAEVSVNQVWLVTGTFEPQAICFERAEKLFPNGLTQAVASTLEEFIRELNSWHDKN